MACIADRAAWRSEIFRPDVADISLGDLIVTGGGQDFVRVYSERVSKAVPFVGESQKRTESHVHCLDS
jgi:hypothetical protein